MEPGWGRIIMGIIKNVLMAFYGYRKFSIMVVLILVGIVFRVMGYINGSEFVDLIKGTGIAFMSCNLGEHLLNTAKSYMKTKFVKIEKIKEKLNVKN